MPTKPHKRHVTKYMQTEVSLRHDGRWAAYAVLTWADLDLVSPEETFAAIHLDQPFRNPLKWVIVGTSPTKEGAVALAVHKKREILARTGGTPECETDANLPGLLGSSMEKETLEPRRTQQEATNFV